MIAEPASAPRHPMNEVPLADAMGIRRLSGADGVAVVEVAWRPDLVGDPASGVLAGGVITSLLDHACGYAVGVAVTEGSAIATLDLRIDYMRAAEPGRAVIGRAHCYKVTRSIAFVRAVAFEEDEADPIATAQGAFAISHDAPAAP